MRIPDRLQPIGDSVQGKIRFYPYNRACFGDAEGLSSFIIIPVILVSIMIPVSVTVSTMLIISIMRLSTPVIIIAIMATIRPITAAERDKCRCQKHCHQDYSFHQTLRGIFFGNGKIAEKMPPSMGFDFGFA